MNEDNKTQFEDEIDLMDYAKVILKRKRTILLWFFGLVILSAVLSFFILPEVYKIDTALEIGILEKADGTKQEQLIESPIQLVGKIDGDVYGIKVREDLNISEAEWPKIKTENPKGTNLIAITIESKETEKSENILREINDLILKEHKEIVKVKQDLIEKNVLSTEKKMGISQEDIQMVENKIKSIQEDVQTTRNKIEPVEDDIERITVKIKNSEEEQENLEAKVNALQEQLVYEQTPGTQFALFDAKEKLANKKQEIENLYLRINSSKRTIEDYNLQISSLQRTIETYNSQINSLEKNIEDYNAHINSLKASLAGIRETRVVKVPTVSEEPVRPRKMLNMAIAGVLGLFIGVFVAFGKEWWETNKGSI